MTDQCDHAYTSTRHLYVLCVVCGVQALAALLSGCVICSRFIGQTFLLQKRLHSFWYSVHVELCFANLWKVAYRWSWYNHLPCWYNQGPCKCQSVHCTCKWSQYRVVLVALTTNVVIGHSCKWSQELRSCKVRWVFLFNQSVRFTVHTLDQDDVT